MNAILDYVMKMLPYMAVSAPVYLLARAVVVRRKKLPKNTARELLLFCFFLFVVGLLSQAVLPAAGEETRVHTNNFLPFCILADSYRQVRAGNLTYLVISLLGNILLFAPLGFLAKALWPLKDRTVILLGAGFSFCIEFCQLFLPRSTDIDDLLCNTLGVALGVLAYRGYCFFKKKKAV